eukprot:215409-Amphidinium_carterae.1
MDKWNYCPLFFHGCKTSLSMTVGTAHKNEGGRGNITPENNPSKEKWSRRAQTKYPTFVFPRISPLVVAAAWLRQVARVR